MNAQQLVNEIGLTANCDCAPCRKLREAVANEPTVNVPPGGASFFGGTPVHNSDPHDILPEPPGIVENAKGADPYNGVDPHGEGLPLPVMTW